MIDVIYEAGQTATPVQIQFNHVSKLFDATKGEINLGDTQSSCLAEIKSPFREWGVIYRVHLFCNGEQFHSADFNSLKHALRACQSTTSQMISSQIEPVLVKQEVA